MNDPLTVVGDVHGQFYDLLKILNIGGDPNKTKVILTFLFRNKMFILSK